MKIARSMKGDYAVRAAVALSRLGPGTRAKRRELSASTGIPDQYVPQIMAALVRGGIVESYAGPDGGYALSRGAEDISLLDVLESVEGPLRNERCIMSGGECSWDHACGAHSALAAAREAFETSLRTSKLSDLHQS